MAPVSNSLTGLQHNRPRPTVSKPIVPAIPLPYIQKRKQQLAAREKAKENIAPTPIVEPKSSPTPPPSSPTPPKSSPTSPPKSSPTSPPSEIVPTIVNGSVDTHVAEKAEEISAPVEQALSITPTIDEDVRRSTNEEPAEADGSGGVPLPDEESDKMSEPPISAPSERTSSASRSTFHMPPAFVPASQSYTLDYSSGRIPPQLNGQFSMHHTHPSAGSVVFGGYPDSNNSSPAPPHSAGNMPPYPYQQQPQGVRYPPHPSNGVYPQQMSPGFPQMGSQAPPGFYLPQGPGAEHFARRQIVNHGPPEGQFTGPLPRVPAVDGPRSFHGSQSSAPNEQESGPTPSQYPTANISIGSNGHIDEVRLHQQPRMNFPGAPQLPPTHGVFPTGPPQVHDYYDGLLAHLQDHFANPEFADCVLELRYSDDRAEPVRISGHILMFARSPYLNTLMKASAEQSNGLPVKTLFIETDDRFLRSDGFWLAVRRLYGGPLLDLGGPAMDHLRRSAQQTSPMAGTRADRLDFALGYAAAGKILQIHAVVNRGTEIASLLIDWDTIEKSLDFAIDGGIDNQWTRHPRQETARGKPTYGPAVNRVIYKVLNFLIDKFPANFELDTTVGEPIYNSRLPAVPQERSSTLNPRLSSIRFGDHSLEDVVQPESGNSVFVILSRVLLNMPFYLLKYVLESPSLGNVEGWANNKLREKVMNAVVEEREKRRLKVLNSPFAPQRTAHQFDDTVRFQESVVLQGEPDGPRLSRTWFETGMFTTSQ